MGWIIEAAIDWFVEMFLDRMSRGKPWWVWVLWLLALIVVPATLFAIVWTFN